MTMALSLLSGNPNIIDLCIFSSILMLKLVIESHHLAQPFQRVYYYCNLLENVILYQYYYSMNKCHLFLFLYFLTIHYMVMFYVLLYTETFVVKFVLYTKNRLPKVIMLAFEICVNIFPCCNSFGHMLNFAN